MLSQRKKPNRMTHSNKQDKIPRDYNITLLISLTITISSISIVIIGFLYNSFVNTQSKRINVLEERILKLEELIYDSEDILNNSMVLCYLPNAQKIDNTIDHLPLGPKLSYRYLSSPLALYDFVLSKDTQAVITLIHGARFRYAAPYPN